MGAAKDLWMMEIEDVEQDYADGKLTEQEAIDALKRLGFDPWEAMDHIYEIANEISSETSTN